MIKNEKQYRITKAQVRRFQDALAGLAGQRRPPNISPRLWEAQRQAAQSQMEELQEQVEDYERLHASGLTQEGLARLLGVKPQQVQRYEATEYESASFGPHSESRPGTRTEHAQSGTTCSQRLVSVTARTA